LIGGVEVPGDFESRRGGGGTFPTRFQAFDFGEGGDGLRVLRAFRCCGWEVGRDVSSIATTALLATGEEPGEGSTDKAGDKVVGEYVKSAPCPSKELRYCLHNFTIKENDI